MRPKQVKGLAQDLGWDRQEAESRSLQRERERKTQAEREEEMADQTGRDATRLLQTGTSLSHPASQPDKGTQLGRAGLCNQQKTRPRTRRETSQMGRLSYEGRETQKPQKATFHIVKVKFSLANKSHE